MATSASPASSSMTPPRGCRAAAARVADADGSADASDLVVVPSAQQAQRTGVGLPARGREGQGAVFDRDAATQSSDAARPGARPHIRADREALMGDDL
jgi:hypothetical protein